MNLFQISKYIFSTLHIKVYDQSSISTDKLPKGSLFEQDQESKDFEKHYLPRTTLMRLIDFKIQTIFSAVYIKVYDQVSFRPTNSPRAHFFVE